MTEPSETPQSEPTEPSQAETFAEHAAQEQVGIVQEFFDFLRHNKKWWLTPIIVILLLITVFAVLAGTGAAPFIYTLF